MNYLEIRLYSITLEIVCIIKITYFYSIVVIVSTFQMPIVLAFTVKHNKNKVNPVVPRQLQFHEENNECFNNDENTLVTPFTGKLHFHEDSEDFNTSDDHSKNKTSKNDLNNSMANVEETSYLPGQICHI